MSQPPPHQRQIHYLSMTVDTEHYCGFIVPFDLNNQPLPDHEKTCAKLLDSKLTWLTARAGNVVMMRHGPEPERPNVWT